MLQDFVDLNNRLFARFTADERRDIGIHTCPGGDSDSVHSKEVPYEKLLSKMFQMNAGYFLIQCASEEDKEDVYRLSSASARPTTAASRPSAATSSRSTARRTSRGTSRCRRSPRASTARAWRLRSSASEAGNLSAN
jgi:hypothetical protein